MKFLFAVIFLMSSVMAFSQSEIMRGKPSNDMSFTFPGNQKPVGEKVKTSFGTLKGGTVDSCGVDSVRYLYSKSTDDEFYYLADTTFNNGGNVHDYYSGYAQYFDAVDSMYVHGACFYGFVFSVGDSAEVTVSIYNAANDSLPDTLISQKSIWVYDDFDANDMNVFRQCVEFDSTIKVFTPYLIAIETETTEELLVLSNSFTNFDGLNEGLGFAYYSNPNYPSFHGWYDQTDFAANWDFDWILEPNVSYPIDADYTLDVTDMCVGDTVCLTNTTSDTNYRSRMYNQNASYNGITYDWGDGSQTVDTTFACHIYSTSGAYNIVHSEEVIGWTSTCTVSHSGTTPLTVNPMPNANFSHIDNLGGSISFADLSSDADSVYWDLGDGSSTTDSSFNYVYSQTGSSYDVVLYAYNDCGIDSMTVTIVPDPTSVNNYLAGQIQVYPNPANEAVFISNNSGDRVDYFLLDVSGKLIETSYLNKSTKVDVASLAQGVYILQLSNGESRTSKRVVITR